MFSPPILVYDVLLPALAVIVTVGSNINIPAVDLILSPVVETRSTVATPELLPY